MAYIDVLPLATAKTYLRIDDTQNETDAEITSMIKSALMFIERKTNIMLYARDKDYVVINGCVRVYDHPINSTVSPLTGVDITTKHYFSNYDIDDSDVDTLTLNVGYADEADVPTDLIDVAKVLVKLMYYEQETDKSFNEMIPGWANEILNNYRRFTI